MISYIEHKVSQEELKAVFRRNIDRNIFISEYPYFGSDENENFYAGFIEDNIRKSKLKAQEDAIELSIAIDFFKSSFFVEIKKIIYSRRQETIKLTCLDWLFKFFQNIPLVDFVEINEYAMMHSKSELLKVQSILNILLIKNDIQLIKELIQQFKRNDTATIFYRLVNGFDKVQLTEKFTVETIRDIKEILMSKSRISKNQKDEIIERL